MSRRFLAAAVLAAAASVVLAADPADERLRQLMERARLRALIPPGPPAALTEAQRAERAARIADGEGALARGDAQAAQAEFERAASYLHAADSEMGLVRAYLQGGEFRRAMAFVAHTASAHRDVPGGAALYAWLLHAGGQAPHASRMLAEARERFGPGQPLIEAVSVELASGRPVARGALLEPPARLAPHDGAGRYPPGAHVAGSAVLFDGGRQAVVPLASVAAARRLWVRNGLGQSSPARVGRSDTALGLALLRIESPLEMPEGWTLVSRDPFPGSLVHAVEYVDAPGMEPRWPMLRSGFLGAPAGRKGLRELGLEWPEGRRGGACLDGAGRLAGVLLPGGRVALASRIRQLARMPDPGDATAAMLPNAPVDQVYEAAMKGTVQVLVAP